MEKIIILAPGGIHTKRWVDALSHRYKIYLFTMHPMYTFESVNVKLIKTKKSLLGFLILIFWIWVYQIRHKPKLIHAHWASSYGTLLNFIPHKKKILSVWGGDVYEFPQRSFIHRLILKFNLNNANILTSTSNIMAKHASKYTTKKFIVVPFGVEITKFRPFFKDKHFNNLEKSDKITIGTVKALSKKYGIDTLLYAIKYIKDNFNNIYLILDCKIYGSGPDLNNLKILAKKLEISEKVKFYGFVKNENVPLVLNSLDIFIALSRFESESFGVAIVEAQACGIPVIVSNVGGLIEVVEDNTTGVIVPKENHKSAANAIVKLIKDSNLRINLSKTARNNVEMKYDFKNNVNEMIKIYDNN